MKIILVLFALFLPLGCGPRPTTERSEEHTSELQSQSNLVCRLLLEKKKKHFQSDRKSTRLNSSHSQISYAVFSLKKKQYAATLLLSTTISIAEPVADLVNT